jgi:hypothetical protein
MQTSRVTARSCITDLAASNASDAVEPDMTVPFRSDDFHRYLRTGAQPSDRGVVGRFDPALACVWHGEELRLRVERPGADAAAEAARRGDVPSLHDVLDMDRASREPALREDQGHGLYVGPVR